MRAFTLHSSNDKHKVTVTPGLTTSYGYLRWVHFRVSKTIVRSWTTSQRSGGLVWRLGRFGHVHKPGYDSREYRVSSDYRTIIWDILSCGHTGPWEIIRPPTMGEVWVIVDHRGWIVRNRAMLYDVEAIEGPSTTSWRFLVMFKNLVATPEVVEYCTIIARRRAASLDIMRRRGYLYHIFTCSHCTAFSRCSMVLRRITTSYEIAQSSYDCNRVQMLTSVSR